MEKQKLIRDYIVLSKLGTGTYGVVYKVVKINTNNLYVIKQIPVDNLTSKQIYEVKQEAKILSCINSIYVVKYYDSFEENNCINIVMEYCDGGDLSRFIENHKQTKKLLKEDLIWSLFLKIAIGLAAIHNLKILHRDLKSLNIFLTKNLDIKIGDLGVAKMLTHTKFAKTFIGTPYYLSPEICQDIPYNDKSDVWALGCILYELCTYRHPFEAKSQGALVLKILRNTPAPIHNYYSSDLQILIDSLLEKDGEIRPSCYDILTAPNIMERARKYGLLEQIKNLYPYIKILNKIILIFINF
jgi:NIMA (never in mitosis gene a)-related kinase